MTYVSHTVRSLRRDPFPDETIRLVVTLADDDVSSDDAADDDVTNDATGDGATDDEATDDEATDDAAASSVAETVESLDGEVIRELAFDRLLVEIDQTDIDSICSLDAASSVETDAVLGPT